MAPSRPISTPDKSHDHQTYRNAGYCRNRGRRRGAGVGDNVLIVHSEANRDSRPHLIGGHGDYVWETGKFSNTPETGLETWFIRGGSAGAAMYKFLQPGIYAYVTHNLIEAADLGATAHFKVDGKWNDDLMSQVKAPAEIPPESTSTN